MAVSKTSPVKDLESLFWIKVFLGFIAFITPFFITLQVYYFSRFDDIQTNVAKGARDLEVIAVRLENLTQRVATNSTTQKEINAALSRIDKEIAIWTKIRETVDTVKERQQLNSKILNDVIKELEEK